MKTDMVDSDAIDVLLASALWMKNETSIDLFHTLSLRSLILRGVRSNQP